MRWYFAVALAWSGACAGSAEPAASVAGGDATTASAVADGTAGGETLGEAGVAETPIDAPGDHADEPPSPLYAAVVRRGGGGDDAAEAEVADVRLTAPLLVYTAALAVRVEHGETATTLERVIEAAVQLGGYLAGRDDRSVRVRIPSVHFREGLAAVEQIGDVTSRTVDAQDVSEEYHDLDVRLANLHALRERLEGLLARAESIEEVLRVERELERISREIDQLAGRLRFLRSRVAFSLVTVTVSERPLVVAATPAAPVAPPPPPPRRLLDLPVDWFDRMGLEALLDL